jgi:cysteine desulfurase/selenocysteine lyase
MYGPTGVGVLVAKEALLDAMPPYQGGGDMILTVTFEKSQYNDLPHKFEAGTPNIAGAIGFGAAIEYINSIGFDAIQAREKELLGYANAKAEAFEGLRRIGTAKEKACVLSFVMDGVHPHDLGTILDREGVAIRAGHHCAMPVMQFYKVPATARASFSIYNTEAEVDALFAALTKAKEMFA